MPKSSSEIAATLKRLADTEGPLSDAIELRQELSENIAFNLYGDGLREEGRQALLMRDALDQSLLSLTPENIRDGDTSAILFIKKSIALEMVAELMQILGKVYLESGGGRKSLKHGLLKLEVDADLFDRFPFSHQEMITEAAHGSSFFVMKRFHAIISMTEDMAHIIESQEDESEE